MTLNGYEKQIEEIQISDLSPGEKREALEMTASEIRGCIWQSHAAGRAHQIAITADSAAAQYPDGGLAALDGLAAKGLLKSK